MKTQNSITNRRDKSKKIRSTFYFLLSTSHGFTLLELLVVITLIGVIGIIISQVFIMTIRSQTKSEILKEVKQNGDYAVSVMELLIRNAVNIDAIGCNLPSSSLGITLADGSYTRFDCIENTNIASVSGTPEVSMPLTGANVSVYNCGSAFMVVCPTPPLSPKYVYINFSLQAAGTEGLGRENKAFLDYQTTVSLRNYQ